MTEERRWRKSSHSDGTEDGNCVEVALTSGACVRDSKNPGGAVLAFAPDAWKKFLETR
jgi:hypothetical protein